MQETVQMLECKLNLFPARFHWRGREYRVEAVNECKTETRRSGARDGMYHFWVRCEGQLLHLSHALDSGCWAMQMEG